MKLNLESSEKWTAKERKKIKKRAITISVLLGIIVFATVALLVTNYIRKSRGLFYPNVELADAVTGAQPLTIPVEGYEQIIKSPTLPYTMLTKGDVVNDSDSFCIFLNDGMYTAIAEIPKNADTCQYLKTAIMPALNGSVTDIKQFKKQVGYLNERQIESQGTTITLSNKSDVYAMNIRVFTPEDKDILISVISSSTNMKDAEKLAENIFYSIHRTDDLVENVDGNQNISGITVDEIDIYGADTYTDYEVSYEEIFENPYIDGYQTEWDIKEPDSYIEGETLTYNVSAWDPDCEWICFGYNGSSKQLKEIVLKAPDGTIYYPDGLKNYMGGYVYGFHLGKGITGEWTFIWTAKDTLGNIITDYALDIDWRKLVTEEMIFD